MYRVLYRKYRPRLFSEVCGQEHITSTLKNEIKCGRISHAYLFTGSRGTGKTSSARILARAVNCPNNSNGEPCNECDICKGLENGTIYDIVEIDAASNNGVDNIRDLREEANYTPSRAKYRVYIIDEVHMLSQGAFNALLKILEEPPEHIIFILATTEVNKIPATIVSRCQRFDFKRVGSEDMTKRLQQISAIEGFNLEKDAATLISRIADGAVRNAISILDQCAGKSTTITSELVSEITGLANNTSLFEISNFILNNDSSAAVNEIGKLYQDSYDMEQLCNEMINHFRNLMIVKNVKNSRDLIICSDDEYTQLQNLSLKYSLEKILYSLDILQKTLSFIKGGANPRIEMEMSIMKLCEPSLDNSVDALNTRISILEDKIKRGNFASSVNNNKAQNIHVPNLINDKMNNINAYNEENTSDITSSNIDDSGQTSSNKAESGSPIKDEGKSGNSHGDIEFDKWPEFLEIIFKGDKALYGVLSGSKGFIRDEFFLIDSPNSTIDQFLKKSTHSNAVKNALYTLTGKQYKLGLYNKNNNKEPAKKDPFEDLINKARGNSKIEIQ